MSDYPIPEHVLEHVRRWGGSMKVSGPDIPEPMSLMDYTLAYYKPWYLDITCDKTAIHESWFPHKDRNTVSGEYFGVGPSLSSWPYDGYILSGQRYPLDAFTRVPFPPIHIGHNSTGGYLICLIPSHPL
jgi:hypothetical protein